MPLDISAKLWGTAACNNSTCHPTAQGKMPVLHTYSCSAWTAGSSWFLSKPASPDFLCSLQNALCTQHRNPLRFFPMNLFPVAGIIQECAWSRSCIFLKQQTSDPTKSPTMRFMEFRPQHSISTEDNPSPCWISSQKAPLRWQQWGQSKALHRAE